MESEAVLLAEFAISKKKKVASKKKKSAAESVSRVPPGVPAKKKKFRGSKSVPALDPGTFQSIQFRTAAHKDLLFLRGLFIWVSLKRLV